MRSSFFSKITRAPTLLALSSMALGLCGCVLFGEDPDPPAPPPAGQADPGASYFTHSYQLIWRDDDYRALTSLTIHHTAGIEVRSASAGAPKGVNPTDLTLSLAVDVQSENHDALAESFDQDLVQSSQVTGARASIQVPTFGCTEKFATSGLPSSVQGVCPRTLLIWVPSTHRIDLSLSWSGSALLSNASLGLLTLWLEPQANAQLTGLSADVSVQGGGAGSSVSIQDLSASSGQVAGGLSVDVSSIGDLTAASVAGPISIAIQTPNGAEVSVDGSAIHQFPYERPAPQASPSPPHFP